MNYKHLRVDTTTGVGPRLDHEVSRLHAGLHGETKGGLLLVSRFPPPTILIL